ncbi:MAG: Serine/threonine-protein kinase [Piccolia ochrophora]|nr:MAG: Serine/threonine-protein kinase [Piccolia ochrophora]
MAAQQPVSSTARRPKETGQSEAVIGRFKIQLEIGKGSFATVYRAIHLKNRSLVAIKSVHLQKLNKKLKENLYSEIDILKGLHHPHIVALIDCQESAAHIHLVMEFCQLGDLSYFIKKRDKLATHPATVDMMKKYPSPQGGGLHEVIVRHFLKQLASALEFLRARNFIHRDVKPQNLLLNPSPLYMAREKGEISYAASEDSLVPVVGVESLPMLKIADFGFARSLPSTSLAETLCGSPLYMAPEILRYEKYDAKADLWSVGTVLYEMMVGRPPFRASNHVELLRKIERGDDRIAFPEGLTLSDDMKKLIRNLLKRNPVERVGFAEFFDHAVVKDDIPGLVWDDRPKSAPVQIKGSEHSRIATQTHNTINHPLNGNGDMDRVVESHEQYAAPPAINPAGKITTRTSKNDAPITSQRQSTGTPIRTSAEARRLSSNTLARTSSQRDQDQNIAPRRPSIVTHATAPSRQELHQGRGLHSAAVALSRQPDVNTATPEPSSALRQHGEGGPGFRQLNVGDSKEAQEKAEQEVAFERDYVVVEKRAVEVNAFADELAASPRLHGTTQHPQSLPHHGVLTRRATTQGATLPTTAAQGSHPRAMQIIPPIRPDQLHQRRSSYERRYGASAGSATSAISKALNMANFRLFGVGFSPPFVGKAGVSPPQAYGAFPAYPSSQSSLVMVGDVPKSAMPQDEDSKAVLVIEESATRSDVVYGFAEVKYKQLIPLAPSTDHGLGLQSAGIPEPKDTKQAPGTEEEGLTVDAIVTLSEEALVLYVKALSLLARSMDIAGAWWARKNRGEVLGDSPSPRSETSATATLAAGNRINNVVQWVRNRFNEVLVKAEFVSLKLVGAQNQLPPDHPSHPSNHHSMSNMGSRSGATTEAVVVSSGVTAEKLMYERALEMSRAAAVNELVGEDLSGCELAYVTAVRMLEAVLEDDDEPTWKTAVGTDREPGISGGKGAINGMQAEDRQVVEKLVVSMRGRLGALRKKVAVMSKRQSAPAKTSLPAKGVNTAAPVSALATTPPR